MWGLIMNSVSSQISNIFQHPFFHGISLVTILVGIVAGTSIYNELRYRVDTLEKWKTDIGKVDRKVDELQNSYNNLDSKLEDRLDDLKNYMEQNREYDSRLAIASTNSLLEKIDDVKGTVNEFNLKLGRFEDNFYRGNGFYRNYPEEVPAANRGRFE